MTIFDIKERTAVTSPYFFSKDTLRFFNQTLSGFRVKKMPDGRFRISQKSKDRNGRLMGVTVRFFNPENNELETE